MIQAACSPVRRDAPSPFPPRFVAAKRPDMALAALAGSDLVARFRHWRGASGQRYLFSVFAVANEDALAQCPPYENAVMLAVARARDGSSRIVWAGQTGALPDLVFDGPLLQDAVAAGANELHMHLLAKDQPARDAIVADIAG